MTTPASAGSSLLRGTLIVSALTQLSRLCGFVRELLTAPLLGTGFFSDAYFVAFRIPNLLRSFVAEGAMTSAFVPLFAGELEKDTRAAERALRAVAGFLLQVTLALSVLGVIFAPEIVRFFAPGFDAEKAAYCTSLTRVMLPYIILVSFISLLNGVLNSVRIFGSAAIAQVLMNVALIAGALLAFSFSQEGRAVVLAWSVLAGGILGVVSQLPALRRAGFRLRFGFSLRDAAVRQLVLLMLPALFGAAVYQINIFISTMLASLLREGSVSWIYYADRLAQFPIGVFTVALGSVLLPALSSAHARGDAQSFSRQLTDSLRYTSFLILPVAFALYYFGEPFFILVLEHGRFTRESSVYCSQALRAFCLGLWAVSCHAIAVKAFLARKDTLTPTLFGVLALLANVFFALVLMGAPEAARTDGVSGAVAALQRGIGALIPLYDLGHVGLALSSSVASFVSFGTLALVLCVRMPQLGWRPFLASTAKSLVCVAACAAVIEFSGLRALAPLPFVCIGIPLTAVLFFAVGKLLHSSEVDDTVALLRKIPAKLRGRR